MHRVSSSRSSLGDPEDQRVRAVYAKDRNGERQWVINTLPRTVHSAIDLPARIDYEYD